MANRYDDYDRERNRDWNREREGNRDRDRDAGRRYDEYRRESRGEDYGQGYGRDRGYGDEERYGQQQGYGSQGRDYDRGQDREEWRNRERGSQWGQGAGGGFGTYAGEDWRSQRQGSYGGGMSERTGRGNESWDRERGYGRGSQGDYRQSGSGQSGYGQGGYTQSGYGQGNYGQSNYGQGSSGTEWNRGISFGGWGTDRDEERSGRFSGRGPKGYNRSDDRVKEDVCERLTQDPNVDASDINVEVKNGEVTLTGSVEDRHQKRAAEQAVENLSGVRDVNNQLKVSRNMMQKAGDALGLTDRDEERNRSTTSTTGTTKQNEPATTRK